MQLINIFFFLALLLAFQANAIKTQNRLGNWFDTLWKTRPTFGKPPATSLSPGEPQQHQQLTQSQGSASAPPAAAAQFASLVGVPVSIISRQSGYFLDVQVTGHLPSAAEIQYLWNNPIVQQALNGTNIQSKLNATNLQELGNELTQYLNGTPLNQLPGLQALLNGTDVTQLLSQLQQQLNVYQLLNGYINSTQLIVRQQSCSISQKWKIIADVNGSYHIASSVVSGVSITINPLAIQNGQVADGARIELLVDAALPSQRFTFEQSSGNFWRIVSTQLSGKSGSQTKKLVLDLQGGNLTQGTPVVASHDTTGDSSANLAEQDWLIIRRECGQSTSTTPTQGAGQSIPPAGLTSPTSISPPINAYSSPQTVSVGQQSPVVGYSSPVVGYSSPQVPYQASSPVAGASPPVYSPPTYGGYGQESSDTGLYSSSGYQSPSAAGYQQSSSALYSSSGYQSPSSTGALYSSSGYQSPSSTGALYSSSGYQSPSSTGALYSSSGYSESPYQAPSPVAGASSSVYSPPTYGGYGQESSDTDLSSGYQQSSTGGAEESSCASDVSSGDYPYQSSPVQGSPSTGNDQLSSTAQYSSISSGSESGSESSAWNTYSAPNYVGAASSPIIVVSTSPASSPIVVVTSPPTGQGNESSPVEAYSSPVVESYSSSDVYSSPAASYSSSAYSSPQTVSVGQQSDVESSPTVVYSPPGVAYSSPAASYSSSGAGSSGASYSSSGASYSSSGASYSSSGASSSDTGASTGGGVVASTGNYARYPGYVPQ